MRILVADDDVVSLTVLKRALHKLGYDCLSAKDGLEAWNIIRSQPIDVVISDWLMPGLDGPALCERIRATADGGYIYFILLTSLTEREHFLAGMSAGADDYLGKPPDLEELRVRLKTAARVTSMHRQLADQAAELASLNDRLLEEVEIARRIQTALLPTDLAIDGFDLAMRMVTATQVGGDLIDYLPQPDGRFWLAVGDVTGHGLTSGLVMMMAQTMLTTLVTGEPKASPSNVLGALNRVFFHNVQDRLRTDNYMTLQVLQHHGNGRFVAAGLHLEALIHRAGSGKVDRLDLPGQWTGLMPDVSDVLEDHFFELAAGDTLLLYTDGLIEARNATGEQFDLPRLEQALRGYAHLPANEILTALLRDVETWQAQQVDDISAIVLRRQ